MSSANGTGPAERIGRLVGAMSKRYRRAAFQVGVAAGRAGLPPESCPYRGDDPRVRGLRSMWLAGYRKAQPDAVSYDD